MKFPVTLEVGYKSNSVGFDCDASYQGLLRLTERNHDVELLSQDLKTGIITVLVKNENAYKDFKYNTEKVFGTSPKYVKEV